MTTTYARAWAVTRRDGLRLGFTDHDSDLLIDGLPCRAGAGMGARALSQSLGLALDNTEAIGALSGAGLTEADILAGRYDGAQVTIWQVDWTAPATPEVLFRGTLGMISRTDGGAFRAEVEGLSAPLDRAAGRVLARPCPAVLGDGACRFDLDTPGYRIETQVLALEGDVLRVPALPLQPAGWFAQGRVEFLTGAAQGLTVPLRADDTEGPTRALRMWVLPGAMPAPGDSLRLTAGCDRTPGACKTKFNNFINYQGFPDIPSEDWLFAPGAADG
jgi:uncharacterized phage protein (TIGR02218 family)